MKPIRSLLLLGALSLLITWLMWPDQNQPGSPSVRESGAPEAERIAPATALEGRAALPKRTKEATAVQEPLSPSALEPARPQNPEDETGKVSVRIVDSFGNHIRQGEILVLQNDDVLQTLTLRQEDGLFHCELPASESYEFMVKPDSLQGGLLPQLVRSRGAQSANLPNGALDLDHFARAYVPLKAGDYLTLDLSVGTPVRAYGRVLGPSGRPAEAIMVVLSAIDKRAGGLAESAMTNELGEFSFAEVFPGNHRMTLYVTPNKVPEGENWNPPAPHDLEVPPGQDMDLGDTQIGGGTASIHGWIVNQDGEPFPGLPVLCFSNQKVEPGLDPHNFASQLGKTVSDADGYFDLTGLAEGPVLITLTPEYNPRFVLGKGHPAIWEANIEVDLASAGPQVNLGELVVEESRPFLLSGNLFFDDTWLASNGHRKEDLRIYLSQTKGAALPEGVRRNPIRKHRVPIDLDLNSYRSPIETPMTSLVLTFKLKGYSELNFTVKPEALQSWTQDIRIPSDFK